MGRRSIKKLELKLISNAKYENKRLIDEIKSMTMDEAKVELERMKKQKEDMDYSFLCNCNNPAFESREFYLECKVRGILR